ncbi:hypothetical protein GQ42DRAFT_162071 [Ramicandelaber brevisporus]|nr:hypothetical protein GQ42DRAFT_162071 [Ramicandelaber brevisporus]
MQLSRSAQLPSFPVSVCFCVSSLPSLSLRPSALSLNRTVSFLLSTLPPSLCTARVCSRLLGRATVGCTSTLQDNQVPVALLVRFLAAAASVVYATSVLTSRRHPSRQPFPPLRRPVRAWLLLVARAASFKVVWSPPIADLAQLCLHPLGSAAYSPGRTFRRRCSLLFSSVYNASYKGSRPRVCLV